MSLRGWNFPHFPAKRENLHYGDTYLECWTEFNDMREVWRLYRSAQFAGLFRFHDFIEDWQARLRMYALGPADDAEGFMSVIRLVYQITEIHEFASRLAKSLQLTDGMVIRYELKNIAKFALSADGDGGRFVSSGIYKAPTLKIEKEYTLVQIADKHRHQALDMVDSIFSRFDVQIRPDVLRQMQDELYALRVGQDWRTGKQTPYQWD